MYSVLRDGCFAIGAVDLCETLQRRLSGFLRVRHCGVKRRHGPRAFAIIHRRLHADYWSLATARRLEDHNLGSEEQQRRFTQVFSTSGFRTIDMHGLRPPVVVATIGTYGRY